MLGELTEVEDVAWLAYSYARVHGAENAIELALLAAEGVASAEVRAKAERVLGEYLRTFPPPMLRKSGLRER